MPSAGPKYVALAAITLDGKIARDVKSGSDWTSKADKVFMRQMLDKSDAIIVGHTTYKIAIKPLAKRSCIVLTRKTAGTGFEQQNPHLAFCDPAKVDLKKIISKKGYGRVAILGGSQIYTYCLSHDMMDEMYLTVEPLAFGRGIDLFSDSPASRTKKLSRFNLVSIEKLNNRGAVLIHYKV